MDIQNNIKYILSKTPNLTVREILFELKKNNYKRNVCIGHTAVTGRLLLMHRLGEVKYKQVYVRTRRRGVWSV